MNHSGWQVLDFSEFSGKLSYKRGRLSAVNKQNSANYEIPLSGVAVILVGGSVSLSGAILAKLSEYDVALLVCDWKGVPTAGVLPWGSHTRMGARQLAQARLSLPRKKSAWAKIIRAKISGQANVLDVEGFRDGAAELRLMVRQVRSGDPDNREAQAARRYWSTISDRTFVREAGSGLAVNNALDYGYSVLRGFGIRAVTAAGLSGTLGLFHHGRANSFSLVDDLMEPFRPAVDFCVFHELKPEEELSRESKQKLVSVCTSAFNSDGHSLATVFEDFAQNYGRYVENDVKNLHVPVWDGEHRSAKEG